MDEKPIEVIMRIDFSASNGTEIVAHAEKVSELIRCKDCKHCVYEEPGMAYCNNIIGSWTSDDFFCKDGERKEDAKNN